MRCVLHSFAHAINIDPNVLIKYLGHDGSSIIDSSLEKPFCYRGFSTFEMVHALYGLGWSTTYWPKYDYICNTVMNTPKFFEVDLIKDYLNESRYCLHSKRHMIGVRDQVILDTMGQCQDVTQFPYEGIYIINKIT